jgi:hypothetical protein
MPWVFAAAALAVFLFLGRVEPPGAAPLEVPVDTALSGPTPRAAHRWAGAVLVVRAHEPGSTAEAATLAEQRVQAERRAKLLLLNEAVQALRARGVSAAEATQRARAFRVVDTKYFADGGVDLIAEVR